MKRFLFTVMVALLLGASLVSAYSHGQFGYATNDEVRQLNVAANTYGDGFVIRSYSRTGFIKPVVYRPVYYPYSYRPYPSAYRYGSTYYRPYRYGYYYGGYRNYMMPMYGYGMMPGYASW